MNAYVTEFSATEVVRAERTVSRAEAYIRETTFDRPTLVIDTEAVASQYRSLKEGLGRATIHYAVKANPDPAVIRKLVGLGSNFDAASRGEIELCLAMGATPDRISFGNTIKRASDIAFAYEKGIRHFAVDAEEEMAKIAEHAPGSQVYVRLIVGSTEADWPLSRKFGCAPAKVVSLMDLATELGLDPIGMSFHVGSQTKRAKGWAETLDQVADVWRSAKAAGHDLSTLNIGGGFPAYYTEEIDAPNAYAALVMAQVEERFGHVPHIMAEPGRGLVAEAGAIAAEVMLVSRKSDADVHRWVYLDIGRFSGLAETESEAIRYAFVTERDHEDFGPCVLAGPSCDSVDVMYEKRPVELPLGLKAGDKIIIRSCGAYTSTYSSVGFNGFPPLDVVAI